MVDPPFYFYAYGFFSILGWPSDFTGAYRQMPLDVLHILMVGIAFWDYRKKKVLFGVFAFYRCLPFGSSTAPAAWSEVSVALAFLMTRIFSVILFHCVGDILNIEIDSTVKSARKAFLHPCKLIGFVLDPEKSILPCDQFMDLGLNGL